VELINGDWDASPLPADWVAALKFTDHFIMTPGPTPRHLRDTLINSFTNSQLAELAIGVGLFHGFSKMLIGLGREPEEMETTIIPTPAMPSGKIEQVASSPHEFSNLFAYIPNIEVRWRTLERSLSRMEALPPNTFNVAKTRMRNLLVANKTSEPLRTPFTELDTLAIEMSEYFTFDVRGITSSVRSMFIERYGADALVQLLFGLALYDGVFRTEATQILSYPPNA
tara:strand:+ start:1334 stop:2011 length:678 start_codon:yes stop_codon:yes gene_type:complete